MGLPFLDQPGTITTALSQPDGSSVSLDMVVVDSIFPTASPSYIVVHEPLFPSVRIAVYAQPTDMIAVGQTLDVRGTVTALDTGRRVILAESIGLYVDEFGNVAGVPPVKGILDPNAWPGRSWIEVQSGTVGASALGMGGPPFASVMTDPPPPPPPAGNPPPGGGTSAPAGSIAWAKLQASGSYLSASLTGKVVTAGKDDFRGFIYVEEPDRSNGIRVITGDTFARGDIVQVRGKVETMPDGEVAISDATVLKVGETASVRPLGTNERALGGGALGTQGAVPTSGAGANTTGLLVTVWGKVKSYDSAGHSLRICDGWSLEGDDGNGMGPDDIYVCADPQTLAVGNLVTISEEAGKLVEVTGLSSCLQAGGQSYRAILPRSQADVHVPSIRITRPSDGQQITKAAGHGLTVSGTLDLGFEPSGQDVKVYLDGGQTGYDGIIDSGASTWTCANLPIPDTDPGVYVQHTITANLLSQSQAVIASHTITMQVTSRPVVYVSASSPGPHNGNSWSTAYHSVQTAVSRVASDPNLADCDIWVAQGVYHETVAVNNIGISLYGGFAGHEAYRELRNWRELETILDGEGRSISVLSISGVESVPQFLVDGLIIRNGVSGDGGGVHISNANGRIVHCTLYHNTASNRGGAVYAEYAEPLIVEDCVLGGSSQDMGNSAGADGGAVCSELSTLQVLGCRVLCNRAHSALQGVQHGGGGIRAYIGGLSVSRCLILGNSAYQYGGGIDAAGCSNVVIEHNLVASNHATYGGIAEKAEGGGLGVFTSGGPICSPVSGRVSCNVFAHNTADNHGGGITYEGSCPEIRNNFIVHNECTGDRGGAGANIYDLNTGIHPLFANNTLLHNFIPAQHDGQPCIGKGAGLLMQSDGAPEVVNCVFAENRAPENQGSAIACRNANTVSVSYSDFWSNVGSQFANLTSPIGTDGNIQADPRLADPHYIVESENCSKSDNVVIESTDDPAGHCKDALITQNMSWLRLDNVQATDVEGTGSMLCHLGVRYSLASNDANAAVTLKVYANDTDLLSTFTLGRTNQWTTLDWYESDGITRRDLSLPLDTTSLKLVIDGLDAGETLKMNYIWLDCCPLLNAHICSDSACADAGYNGDQQMIIPDYDFDGDQRPSLGPSGIELITDIGADEWLYTPCASKADVDAKADNTPVYLASWLVDWVEPIWFGTSGFCVTDTTGNPVSVLYAGSPPVTGTHVRVCGVLKVDPLTQQRTIDARAVSQP